MSSTRTTTTTTETLRQQGRHAVYPNTRPPTRPLAHKHSKAEEHFLHITVLMCLTAACKKPSNLGKSRRGSARKRTLSPSSTHTHTHTHTYTNMYPEWEGPHLCMWGCVRVNDFLHTASQLDALGLSALWILSSRSPLFALPNHVLYICVYMGYTMWVGINLYG